MGNVILKVINNNPDDSGLFFDGNPEGKAAATKVIQSVVGSA